MLIKKLLSLSLILLFLIAPASAYGIREENIWIFQGSYELGTGDRAYLEGFTVKIHDINSGNNPSATLLIYRNGVFKEAFQVDTDLNNKHIYNNELRIDVLAISQEKVSLEIYKQKTELVWVTDIPKTSFRIGDTLTEDGYKISFTDLTEEGALIAVEHDGNYFEDTYNSGDYRKFSDDFMINVIYLKKDTEEVFIETLKPGSPEIKIEVGNIKDSYEPDGDVEFELIVTNNGTIPLHGMILTTECDDGTVELPTQQHSILESGKKKLFLINVDPEMEPMGKNISIVSKVQGYDYRGNEYNSETTTEVRIEPYLSIKKEIYSKEKSSDNPEFGTEQYFQIVLTLENKANFRTAVTVTDELPESFIPEELDNPEWAMVLDAESTKTIEYFASPTEPGDFTFGPATVLWKDDGETYTLESEYTDQNYHVSGSKVIVKKELSSGYMLVGEEISVNIKVINEGDRSIEASFSDTIPDELSYVEGDNSWEGTLDAGETKEFSYVVRAESSGEYYLSETELDYSDDDGKKDSEVSGSPFLYIDDPSMADEIYNEDSYSEAYNDLEPETESTTGESDITRTEAAGFLVSSFAALFALIAIVPAFAYLYIIRVYK